MLEKANMVPLKTWSKRQCRLDYTKIQEQITADPEARLDGFENQNGRFTGWATLDKRLFGGFNKGELNIFAGGLCR